MKTSYKVLYGNSEKRHVRSDSRPGKLVFPVLDSILFLVNVPGESIRHEWGRQVLPVSPEHV